VNASEEPSATEQLARIQLEKIRNEEKSKRVGCIGCLGLIAVIVVVSLISSVSTNSRKGPATLNDMSRFARSAHLILAADYLASQTIAQETHDGSYTQAYADADRAATVLSEAASGLGAPVGFERSGNAFSDYASEASRAYRSIADDMNNPSLRGNVEVVRSMAAGSAYAKRAIDSFKSDLAHVRLSHAEKERLINRLLGG
jgi:hypothetical protein